ncbi:peptide chain release factor H [Eisenbergiella sp.]
MIFQISAGQGPEECELAAGRIFEALQKEFPQIVKISGKKGEGKGCYESITFSADSSLAFLEGTVQWICQSPFRPGHKRKNWFIDISIIPERKDIREDRDYRIEKFHCGGNGGQNVNKVETGIRIVHIPTGITAVSTEERSQYRNKQRAMEKIDARLADLKRQRATEQKNQAWREHSRIVRGNPVRVYTGLEFSLTEK